MKKDRLRILVGEDDPGIIEVVTIILKDAGYIPLTASSIYEIEDILKKEKISLIFLDVLLRGESGKVVAKKIKSDPLTAEIPLIMLSANMEIADIAKEVKADSYLQKPFDIDDFLGTISKYTKS